MCVETLGTTDGLDYGRDFRNGWDERTCIKTVDQTDGLDDGRDFMRVNNGQGEITRNNRT